MTVEGVDVFNNMKTAVHKIAASGIAKEVNEVSVAISDIVAQVLETKKTFLCWSYESIGL